MTAALNRRQFLLGRASAGGSARAARVHDHCFEIRGIVCQRCRDVCEPRALLFLPLPGGFARPFVDTGRCTACGECIAACPASAITMEGGTR